MPVHEVLNKFVADTVVEKVKPHMSYITFKVFDWPGFEVLAPPQPAAETESTSNTT